MTVVADIPSPKGLPFLGNILDLQDEVPVKAMERLADIYGPIFKVNTLGRETIIVSGFDVFDELCDETRFYKLLGGKLADAADQGSQRPRGLFTQPTEKAEDWGQAHRILMPAFGPLAVADMFNGTSISLALLQSLLEAGRHRVGYISGAKADKSEQKCTTLAANLF